MKYALIRDGLVQSETDEATASLKGADGKSLFDVRDVSSVEGIAPGWLVNADGSYSAPEAPPPVPITTRTFFEFMNLFNGDEQVAIVNSTDPKVRLFCLMAAGATTVDLSDQKIIDGTKQLEALKLIGKGRAAQVLAGSDPSA